MTRKWQDLASQEFLETTGGTKEYWQKQAIMFKQDFRELFEELEQIKANRDELHKALKEFIESHCYWRTAYIGHRTNMATVYLSDEQLRAYRDLIAK